MFSDSKLESILVSAGLSHSALESDPAVIYILRPDLRIIYCNRAWEQFASENQGKGLSRLEVLGTAFLSAVPDPLSNFYANGFAEAHRTGVWEHDFECSSPELFRLFHMRVLRLAGLHLLVENSIRIERPHQRESPVKTEFNTYVNKYGISTMCCHCRRTRRIGPGGKEMWDWIPNFLREQPGKVSHGLCKTCTAYFYSDYECTSTSIQS
jgi:hypothetical protein